MEKKSVFLNFVWVKDVFIPGEFRSYLKVCNFFFLGTITVLGVSNHYNVHSASYISEDTLNNLYYRIMKT